MGNRKINQWQGGDRQIKHKQTNTLNKFKKPTREKSETMRIKSEIILTQMWHSVNLL